VREHAVLRLRRHADDEVQRRGYRDRLPCLRDNADDRPPAAPACATLAADAGGPGPRDREHKEDEPRNRLRGNQFSPAGRAPRERSRTSLSAPRRPRAAPRTGSKRYQEHPC
jgi:hypothetical protein